MTRFSLEAAWRDYTTVLVLVALCALLSLLTLDKQFPSGAPGGQQLAALIRANAPTGTGVLIVVRDTADDAAFGRVVHEELADGLACHREHGARVERAGERLQRTKGSESARGCPAPLRTRG